MRIYSKFKDYYDPVLKMYQSETLPVYDRTETEVTNALKDIEIVSIFNGCICNTSRVHIDSHEYHDIGYVNVVGFCGKLYPYVPVTIEKDSWNGSCETTTKFIYDPVYLDKYYKNDDKYYFTRRNTFVDTFNYINKNNKLLDIFMDHKTPIFNISKTNHNGYVLNINPQLKSIGFQSVFDPYTAMQEIHMFLNNTLVSETEVDVPTGSDDDLLRSKGFYEYSFKNIPGKKKNGKNRRSQGKD